MESPSQARKANVDFDVDEQVTHAQSALNWQLDKGNTQSNAYAYVSYRDFSATLPYKTGGATAFTRWYGGGGYQTTTTKRWGLLGWGASYQSQKEQRQRFDNLN